MSGTVREGETAGPIGLLAGGGTIPVSIAQTLTGRGRAVHVVSLIPVDPALYSPATVTTISIGQIGTMLHAFRAHGCRDVMISGSLSRPDLARIRPDLGFFLNLPSILALMRGGDDRLLRRVIRFFEGKGFRVRGMADETPSLLAGEGPLGDVAPSPSMISDATLGLSVIGALGALDMGQAVVVSNGRLVAVEGIEGTDGLLARLEGRADAIGGVLVKATKPEQERRVDLPTIGPVTVDKAKAAVLAGIAVEAGVTVVAEQGVTCAAADVAGVALWGMRRDANSPIAPAEGAATQGMTRVALVGRVGSNRGGLRDTGLGLAALAALMPFGGGTAAVVSREHVLAVGVAEPPVDVIARAAKARPWGDRGSGRRRRGVVVLRSSNELEEPVIAAAARAGLRAIHVRGALDILPGVARAKLAALADRHQVALTEDVA
ncbi:MAG: UDP-2,3-diacylglucosamine diphosphatase LpxI [Hyphomicrobiaceae bacterium]|nr:UDP-2,3-diacylglucosamine diphosphatase LpxI [Hyphomicrobiaceae bacterium]